MTDEAVIEIVVDPSLVEHVAQHLARKNRTITPEEAITGLVSTILDNSPYPIRAQRTGEREVRISYHVRSFSQPIFQ